MEEAAKKRQTALICVGIGLATLTAYQSLWRCGFVNYDDGDYVYKNPMVQGGLSWAGVKWAFTTYHSGNWHPMTWLSLMLDSQLWGGIRWPTTPPIWDCT